MIPRVRPRAIVVDSISRLRDLLRCGIPGNGYHPAILVRIQAVGSNLNKFGQPMFIADPDRPGDVKAVRVKSKDVCDVLREAATAGGFSQLGVSFHVGTQCVDPHRYKLMLGVVRRTIIDVLAAEGVRIGIVDIGGGFSDARTALANSVSQRKLLSRIEAYLRDPKYVPPGTAVFAEPGRFLVADAGAIVTEFIARTEFKSYELPPELQQELGLSGEQAEQGSIVLRLEINDSLYNNLLPQIHDDREWQIVPFVREPRSQLLSAELSPCIVFGHTCDGFDRLQCRGGFRLPGNIAEGTLGLLACAGAYTRETAANFNGFAKSDVITFVTTGEATRCHIDRADRPWKGIPDVSDVLLRSS
jgi:ornithine decarboxylase